MIALLHDFLPRGAKRVLIAVAGIFGAAFSFAFVDMMPFLIWMLIFVAADSRPYSMPRGRLAPIRAAPVAAEYEMKKGFISEALYSHDMPQISLHRKSNLKMILFRL